MSGDNVLRVTPATSIGLVLVAIGACLVLYAVFVGARKWLELRRAQREAAYQAWCARTEQPAAVESVQVRFTDWPTT